MPFSLDKGLQEKQAFTGDYDTSLRGEPIEQQDPMASTTIAQNFAEKVSRCRHVLDPAVVIKRDGKVAKGKRKNQPGKRGQTKANETESASAESLRVH